MNGAKPVTTIEALEKNTTMEVPRPVPQQTPTPPQQVTPQTAKPIEPTFDFEKKEEPKTEPTIEQLVTPEEPVVEEPKGGVESSLKDMRKLLNETKTTIKAKDAEIEEVKTKLTKYEKGELFPEVIQEKDAEIARLSPFEKLHSLKTSREYREYFVKPMNQLTEKLEAIAKDYDLPPEVAKEALNINNRAELNRFLSNHFDEVGALEVKEVINGIKNLQQNAQAAEAEPAKALADMQAHNQNVEAQRKKHKLGVMANTSRSAWADSLNQIKEEGQIHELIFDDNDSEHNENFVKPIVTQAAAEYGKLVTMLAEAGLEDLPQNVAKALARMSQLAHASAISIHSREQAVKHARELEKNTNRTNGYYRPSMSGSNAGGSGSSASGTGALTPGKPTELKQATSEILSKVMGSR